MRTMQRAVVSDGHWLFERDNASVSEFACLESVLMFSGLQNLCHWETYYRGLNKGLVYGFRG